MSEEHIPSKVDVTTVDITENGNHVDMQKDLRRIIHLSRTLATTDELKASQVASTSRLESMLQANIEELRQNQADSFKSIQETVDKTQAIVQDFIKSQADYFDSFQKTSEATRATIVHLEKVQVDSFQRIPQTSKESLDNISGLTSDIQAFRRDITEQLSGFRESVESTTKRLVHSQEKSQPVLQRLNVEFGHLDAVVRGIQTHVVQILGICQQDLAAKE